MNKMVRFLISVFVIGVAVSIPNDSFAKSNTSQWSIAKTRNWSARQGWIIGGNFTPASAINQIEMWQKETFDPARIDLELGYAERLGMNTMRVFLHDLVWQADAKGFARRIDQFLTIAARHHIRPIFVLFDSCWDPRPQLGKQRDPRPGVHNSGWVQSPSVAALLDPAEAPRLERYVREVVGIFAQDPRILAWDVWNEPDNMNGGTYSDPEAKLRAVENLLPQVFAWARSAQPSQPLTSGVWSGEWSSNEHLRPVERTQLFLSDIISFHSYEPAPEFERRVRSLSRFGRPILCTEYLARALGSTFQTILPIAKRYGVGMFNWGFVAGKTQTYFPWDSWEHPYPGPPKIWFHDIFYPNGTPYDLSEVKFIQQMIRGNEKYSKRPNLGPNSSDRSPDSY